MKAVIGGKKEMNSRKTKESGILECTYVPGTVVGQRRGGATHTPLVHRPYRQSLLAVQAVPTAPLAIPMLVDAL